jgi:hypothetical protein
MSAERITWAKDEHHNDVRAQLFVIPHKSESPHHRSIDAHPSGESAASRPGVARCRYRAGWPSFVKAEFWDRDAWLAAVESGKAVPRAILVVE